jgi:hypothetical protein
VNIQEFLLGLSVLGVFVGLRFGVPMAIMAIVCQCDRRFLHTSH